ncbi:MAG: HoxN/HupN/NixA family nickel/cobalt transporter [Burkholderiales bacterium]|nr:HoxN/HupN/NixA family nickel/cobalt transporter [Burkholderiales bacterium]
MAAGCDPARFPELSPAPASVHATRFTPAQWRHLVGYYGVITALHVAGWGLYLHYAGSHPSLVGLGFVAYMLGVRHAFDADHIAAIDDTVRFLLQKGRSPLGVGFYFSLGHASIVVVLALAVAVAAGLVARRMPQMQEWGGLIGASVSGTFLMVIAVLNLIVLMELLGVWQRARAGTHSHAHLEALLARRGLVNRLLGGRASKWIDHAWHMYPLGLLFGLGFDTASEVALLAMTGGAAAGSLPFGAVACLPLLFAAGMSLLDTTDGVLMAKAYGWAFVDPLRRIFYNIATTALSVVVALAIGFVQLAQVVIEVSGAQGTLAATIGAIDFAYAGYVIVALFLVAWGSSVAWWKFGGIAARR